MTFRLPATFHQPLSTRPRKPFRNIRRQRNTRLNLGRSSSSLWSSLWSSLCCNTPTEFLRYRDTTSRQSKVPRPNNRYRDTRRDNLYTTGRRPLGRTLAIVRPSISFDNVTRPCCNPSHRQGPRMSSLSSRLSSRSSRLTSSRSSRLWSFPRTEPMQFHTRRPTTFSTARDRDTTPRTGRRF